MKNLLSVSTEILKNHYLCLNCLGRLFARLSTGLTNNERGKIIIEFIVMDLASKLLSQKRVDKKLLSSLIYRYNIKYLNELAIQNGLQIPIPKHIYKTNHKTCEICNDIMLRIDDYATKIAKALSRHKIGTFHIGIKSIPEIEKKEDFIRSRYKLPYGENIRNELSREIGKRLEKITQFKYSIERPDVTIVLNPLTNKVEISSRPIMLYGEIYKLSDVPVFAKVCKECKGKGCTKCNFIGRLKGESIEYILGEILKDLVGILKWKFSIKYGEDKNIILFKMQLMNPQTTINQDIIKKVEKTFNEKLKEKAILRLLKIM